MRRICFLALAEERIDASGESFDAPSARDFAFEVCRDFPARDRAADGVGAVDSARDAEALCVHGFGLAAAR